MPDKKRYRIDCDYGSVLYRLIDGYAGVQGITMSSFLRQLVSEGLRSEVNNVSPGYTPKITRTKK